MALDYTDYNERRFMSQGKSWAYDPCDIQFIILL